MSAIANSTMGPEWNEQTLAGQTYNTMVHHRHPPSDVLFTRRAVEKCLSALSIREEELPIA